MQKKVIIFFLNIILWGGISLIILPCSAAAAENTKDIVLVTSEETLATGMSLVLSVGLTREDTDYFRKLVRDADALLMRIFRFQRGAVANGMKIQVEPVTDDAPEISFSSEDGGVIMHCPGDTRLWRNDPLLLRELLEKMTLAALGSSPEDREAGCDWIWNGLAAFMELPGQEDTIVRVGYYFSLQDGFLQKLEPDWERMMVLDGPPVSGAESELCRLLLDVSRLLDTGSQRMLQDYVLLVMEGRRDNVSAFWSTIGFGISEGGKNRQKGLSNLTARARGRVFSRLSPLPGWRLSGIFEGYGRETVIVFEAGEDEKMVEISGTWDDWPHWSRQYDVKNAAEKMAGLLGAFSREVPAQIVPALDDMRKVLSAVVSGVPVDGARWSAVVSAVRDEIYRQQEIEAILFRLEERNPAINERLRTRLDALQKSETFPLPSNFEKLLQETESVFTRTGRR